MCLNYDNRLNLFRKKRQTGESHIGPNFTAKVCLYGLNIVSYIGSTLTAGRLFTIIFVMKDLEQENSGWQYKESGS